MKRYITNLYHIQKSKMNLKLYLIIISICALIGSLIISVAYDVMYFSILGIMILGIFIVIIIDGVTAAISRALPTKFANFNSKIFLVSKSEKNFYDKLRIKKWKEKIPEIGHFTGFRKNSIAEPKNPDYIKRFLVEICYGEIGHLVSVFTGFLLLLLPWFNPHWLAISLVISIVNGILNLLPVFVLRYNSYSLLLIYKRLTKTNN